MRIARRSCSTEPRIPKAVSTRSFSPLGRGEASPRLYREFAPDGGVVRGAVLGPGLLVDVAGGDPVRRLRRQQQMVDSQALVAVPASGLIIPESVAMRFAMEDAVSVGQPEVDQ